MSQLIAKKRVFVLGAPRSGTTFLASLLKDTRYGSPVETHFITKYYKKLASYGDLSQRINVTKLAKDILAERPVRQWNLQISADELFDVFDGQPSLARLTDHIMLLARRKKNISATSWGDKTPHYLGDWKILHALFPDAKFIYIARDGRDVALSLQKKPWGPSTTIGCAQYWSKLNSQKRELHRHLESEQILFLQYEELIRNPRENVKAIYGFLGEPLTEDALKRMTAATKADNSDKWKNLMTKAQVRQFEAIAGDRLDELSYCRENKKPKLFPGEILISRVLETLNRMHFLFKANVVDYIQIRFFGKQPFSE